MVYCRRRVSALLLLVVLSGCANPQSQDLRVMSFNLRYGTAADGDNAWEHRRALLIETIAAFNPDVLGMQECLARQAEFLQAELPDYGFLGVGRDDGAAAGEMCAIFYRKARFENLAEGHFWLSETPEVVASVGWDACLTRMASWIRLRTRGPRPDTLCVINTHLDHQGQLSRRESGLLIRRKIVEICGQAPIIVTGDFNAPADLSVEGPYGALMEDGDLKDTYRVHFPEPALNEGTFNGFTGTTSGARIDWILVSDNFTVHRAAIDRTEREGRYPSDHFPVTAVLTLAP